MSVSNFKRRVLPAALAVAALAAVTASSVLASGSSIASQPGCVQPPADRVGWWPGDGNADDIVGSNPGTLNGNASFTTGKVGQAFSLDGSGDYVTLPGTFGGGPQATIDAWVKTSATTFDFQAVVSPTGSTFVHLQLFQVGNIVAYADGVAPQWAVQLPIVLQSPTGVWRHIAVSVKSGDSRLYVDGQLVGSSTATYGLITPTSDLRIGSGYAGGRFFNGAIDEVGIFSRALSQTEIQTIYNAGSAGTCTPDTTKPVITGSRSPAAGNANGWNNTDVVVDFTCADEADGSGIGTNTVAGATLSDDGAGQSVTNTGSCADLAGNTADQVTVGDINIDKTGPTVSCQAGPAFTLGQTDSLVLADVSDTLSGPAAETAGTAADTSSVGPKQIDVTGVDMAGNARTVSCPYVVTYAFAGFFQPVDNGGVLNIVKAGRAVPLKWRITDADGAPVTNLAAATISVQGLSCSSGASEDLIEETTAGGSGLQNLGDGIYQLNWKSPTSYAGSCKTLRLDLGEGVHRTALFRFTK